MLCAKKFCTYSFALTHTGKVKKYTFYISAIWHLFFKSCCSFLFYNKNKSMRLLCRIYYLMASGALKRTRFHRFINNIPVASEHFWTRVGYSKNGWPIILDWNLRFWMVLKGFVDIKYCIRFLWKPLRILHPTFPPTLLRNVNKGIKFTCVMSQWTRAIYTYRSIAVNKASVLNFMWTK